MPRTPSQTQPQPQTTQPDRAGSGQQGRLFLVPPPAVDTTPTRVGWSRRISRAATGAAQEVIASAAAVCRTLVRPADETMLGVTGHRQPLPLSLVRDQAEPPVVLVHGFAASRTCWFAVRRALRADGRTVVSLDYSPWASSVDELADRLVDTVEDLLAVTGAEKVHLIGHSLGGVIIAQALTRDRLAGRVDLVVTLGSPFGGTLWAGLLPVAPLVRVLRPGSALLRCLAAAPPPPGVRWLAFASTADPIVPADRAVPANRDATLVSIDGTGHSGMLLAPDVIEHIVAATKGARRTAGRPHLLAA